MNNFGKKYERKLKSFNNKNFGFANLKKDHIPKKNFSTVLNLEMNTSMF